jgi:methylthioribose-1-phosphate isomerase
VINKNSIILLQGIFEPSVFDLLKKRKAVEVNVLEGRPGLDAARHSCRELLKRKIRPTLITDNMAGFLFYKKLVKEIWVSYQSAEKNGVLCQIGGLILGVLGRKHGVPVYAYPSSRKVALLGRPKDISYFNGIKVAANNTPCYVPLVEQVPGKYIERIYG